MRSVSLAVMLMLLVLLPACKRPGERMFRETGFVMDTIVTITVVAEDEEEAGAAIEKGLDELRRLEGLLNFFSEKSEITRINRNAGLGPVKVSEETFEVVRRAVEVSEETGGAFDITVGRLTGLYDFHKKILPSEEEIREALRFVNFRDIILDSKAGTVFLRKKGMVVDTGGIAKGFAADRVVAVLKGLGIKAALVAVAGDIRGYGLKPDGTPWKVGIKDPRGGKDDLIAVLSLKDSAISTSGDYERFFIRDGVRYHHLLDPATGHPARGLRSVTVIAPEGVLTDSLATALFIAGPERGMGIIRRLGFDAVMVDEAGKIIMTEGLKDRLRIIEKGG